MQVYRRQCVTPAGSWKVTSPSGHLVLLRERRWNPLALLLPAGFRPRKASSAFTAVFQQMWSDVVIVSDLAIDGLFTVLSVDQVIYSYRTLVPVIPRRCICDAAPMRRESAVEQE